MDVALPGQAFEITVDHAQGNPQLLAEGSLSDGLSPGNFIQDLEGVDQISVFFIQVRGCLVCLLKFHVHLLNKYIHHMESVKSDQANIYPI